MSSVLQQKLSGFEAAPPSGAWDRIADALDAEEEYPQRLFLYEEAPPPTAWRGIEALLNETAAPAKVVPFFTAYKKPFRALAAASLIAAVLIGAVLLIQQSGDGTLTGTTANALPSAEKGKKAGSSPALNNQLATRETASLPAKKPESRSVAAARRILAFIRPQIGLRGSSFTARFIPKKVAEQNLLNSTALDDLMVYSDNDGNVMKLPKKLFSLVSCQDGDGSCKERVQLLREKLSANNVSPDFFGMLDQLRQLQ